jgi:dTDP-4-dehydrorhamnose reductase
LYEIVLAGGLYGIFHAGGPRRLSLYEIAQIVNRVGGYDPECLFGIPRTDAGPVPPRAGDVTLDSSKLIDTLGFDPFDPWPLDERLVPTHRRWHHDRPAHQPGSPDYLRQVLHNNPSRQAR